MEFFDGTPKAFDHARSGDGAMKILVRKDAA